jgi:hypothetical protein
MWGIYWNLLASSICIYVKLFYINYLSKIVSRPFLYAENSKLKLASNRSINNCDWSKITKMYILRNNAHQTRSLDSRTKPHWRGRLSKVWKFTLIFKIDILFKVFDIRKHGSVSLYLCFKLFTVLQPLNDFDILFKRLMLREYWLKLFFYRPLRYHLVSSSLFGALNG